MQQNFNVQNYQLFQEISAGGVVILEKNGEQFIITIERKKMKDQCLPKGHQDPNESLQKTAIREVKEETGCEAQILTYLGPFTYSVKSDSNKTITIITVHWFLMKVIGGAEREANAEVKKINLTPIDGDFSFLTYDNDRMFIEKAKKVLKKLPNS